MCVPFFFLLQKRPHLFKQLVCAIEGRKEEEEEKKKARISASGGRIY